MASTYYEPGSGRAARVASLFDRIAPRYDLINDLQCFGLHRLWKRRLVRLAGVKSGERALDLCCGTGDVTFALARSGANTTGIDFSEPMLSMARKRAASLPDARVTSAEFVHGDALNLPFADGSFDLVTISYGLRNLASFERGLEEMARVLKPCGRLLILDFGRPENPAWRWLYEQYLRFIVPLYGWLFCGDRHAYAYILESLVHYPGQRGVDRLMKQLGFTDTRVDDLLGGVMALNLGRRSASPSR